LADLIGPDMIVPILNECVLFEEIRQLIDVARINGFAEAESRIRRDTIARSMSARKSNCSGLSMRDSSSRFVLE
jgi:hypothetical protein